MRRLDLYRDRQANTLVQGINAPAPVVLPEVAQNDTLQLAIHNLERNPAVPALTSYVEQPWAFTGIRASIGLIDAAPDTGTFKLTVLDQTTTDITWPADLSTAALVAAFRATILAALKALSNVADGDIVLSMPPVTVPANFIYLTWTDPAREDPIGIADNALAPVSVFSSKVQRAAPGYQQLLKFTQLPIALTDTFTFPSAPVATVIEDRAGATGANAVQILVVPAGALGSLALGWAGAQTRTMAVGNLTGAQIAAALNAIPVDGATNPSFRAESRGGGRFAIELIGPLAGAAQALLTVTMHDQVPLIYALGSLPLTNPRFERVLNGAASARLRFELVITDAGGESTIVQDISLLNDMTDGDTVEDIAQADAILTRTETVYIDSGAGSETSVAIVTAAPGFAFTPSTVSQSFTITHNLGTFYPDVRGFYKTSLSPEQWREMTLNAEFATLATSANVVVVTIAALITSGSSDAGYYGRFKFFAASPDATVALLAHNHPWADIRETLPSGQTLAAKLAALEAAIGIASGNLSIDASHITGLLKSSQIDLTSLAAGLQTSTAFVDALRAIFTSDTQLIDIIGTGLKSSATFLETLGLLLKNTDILEQLIKSLVESASFKAAVIAAIQSGAISGLLIPITLPVIDLQLPAAAPALIPTTVFNPTVISTPSGIYLPRAKDNKGKYFTASATIYTHAKARKFQAGDTVYSNGLDWILADSAAAFTKTVLFPRDMSVNLFTLDVSDAMLADQTQFVCQFAFTLQMAANCSGRYIFELARGTLLSATGPANFDSVTWDETIISQPIVVTAAAVTHRFGYTVKRTDTITTPAVLGTDSIVITPAVTTLHLIATKLLYSETVHIRPPDKPAFILRARLTRFDADVDLDPFGQVSVRMESTKASASIAKLT